MNPLALVPWRVWAGAGLGLLLVGSLWWVHHRGYQAGWERASAQIRSEWAADTARREKARQRALDAAQAELERQRAVTEEVERGLSDKLAAADARGRDLSRRLRDALGAAGSCPVPAAGGTSGPADGAGAVATDPGAVGASLADHLASCEQDAQRLTELQGWVRGIIER